MRTVAITTTSRGTRLRIARAPLPAPDVPAVLLRRPDSGHAVVVAACWVEPDRLPGLVDQLTRAGNL